MYWSKSTNRLCSLVNIVCHADRPTKRFTRLSPAVKITVQDFRFLHLDWSKGSTEMGSPNGCSKLEVFLEWRPLVQIHVIFLKKKGGGEFFSGMVLKPRENFAWTGAASVMDRVSPAVNHTKPSSTIFCLLSVPKWDFFKKEKLRNVNWNIKLSSC